MKAAEIQAAEELLKESKRLLTKLPAQVKDAVAAFLTQN